MPQRTHESITFLPVFHGRLEFAAVVRETLLADPPGVVAVELPATWRVPLMQAVNRLPFLSLLLDEEGDGGLEGDGGADGEAAHAFLTVEPTDGLIEALRTAKELGLPAELIDLDVPRYAGHLEPLPDPLAMTRLGYDAYLDAWYENTPLPRHEQDRQRETMMAHALQQLAAEGRRVTCVLGAAHLPGVLERLAAPQPRPLARVRPRRLALYNWSLKSSMECMAEPPYLAAAYEHWRKDAGEAPGGPNREQETDTLLRTAADSYQEHFAEELEWRQLAQVGRFARRYALVDGLLAPDLFQLVTAARGVVDDDYAYEVWDYGSGYPWQDGSGLLPTIDLDETAAYVRGRRMTLHRKVRRRRPQLREFSRRKRLRERSQGQWKSEWSGDTICSHPPEDLIIEDYGRYLRHKARGMLSAERSRVEPFTVSIKDGVDVRETLRNWHQDKLYVRELGTVTGKVGSVVVIFDTDEDARREGGERYPWRVTWLGEHSQESDMAFYATPAGEQLVGPGISRCEYGGFVMSYPPRRMFDVWGDPMYDLARNKPEILLLAGLDYAEERMVLYVADKPPRSMFRTLAGRLGRQLVYLPLGQLNPGTLRQIRAFHVLDGHQVREIADQYIR